MRLTCPNCSAEYEVDAALIPDEGRDVQCSNCGKTWFELPPAAVTESAATADAPVSDARGSTSEDEGDASEWEVATDDAASPESQEEPDTEPEERAVAAPVPAPAPAPALKRREVDPRALDILKEEADRELANRRKERETVEVQSEFDLSEGTGGGAEPSRALRARMARLRGESEPKPQREPSRRSEGSGYGTPERELLPDIEEINSSLRPPDADIEAAEAARRADFRKGFGVMIGLSAFLVAIYIAAPAIARSMPGLQPVMVAYLDAANGFRDIVDNLLR